LNILAHVHGYPPAHNAGAEIMLHALLKEMKSRGHRVAVLLGQNIANEYEGVKIFSEEEPEEAYRKAHVVITHLERTKVVMDLCNKLNKPLVHLIHNDKQLDFWRIKQQAKSPTLVVFNSKWIEKASALSWNGPKVVVIPPVDLEAYKVDPVGPYITLINLNTEKGGPLFFDLARMMTKKRFLGVKGGYGTQMIPDEVPMNVKIVEHTINNQMSEVYKQTRILLMPSRYESWGRVAIEAASSGIPVIANPTPGLQEALGNAGIFADWSKPREWVNAIRSLDDPYVYNQYSHAIKKKAQELDPKPYYDIFENALIDLVGGGKRNG
jgi:glycosyltransferase involved in cell wall biosynthesis